MATIFFTSLGSLIGCAAGFPSVGKFLGGRLGSYFSQKLFKSEKFRSNSSSRLEDLFIQSSAYGRVIPICFGSFRFAGNIIWAMPIKEILSTDLISLDGGNGGGATGFVKGVLGGSYSPKTTIEQKTYNYYATLAIGICEGEVDSLTRIWADNVILDLKKLKYRFHKGSKDQLPDSLISGVIGISMSPGFRDLCYIVIEDFHINPYGNRIPDFTFEIKRNLKTEKSLENQIEAVNLIPGSGEFVYDTKLVFKKQIENFNGHEIVNEQKTCINNASEDSSKPDAILGLDQMGSELGGVKWVNVVVSWFASSLNLGALKLYPAVEFSDIMTFDENEFEEPWSVAGLTRSAAKIIGRDPSDLSRPNYGGTPSDSSLKRYLTELKKRGYKIILYPMIFVDLPDKPWRGFISGQSADLEKFFKGVSENRSKNTFSYFEFILHYAKNFVSLIDGLIIGSELKGVTKISNEVIDSNSGKKSLEFLAVSFLKELAGKVRREAFLDDKKKIIVYASDWSEYHSDSGWFFMDDLHSDENIDFVGIDAYFPLTDSESLSFLPSKDEIKKGFESGEGFEYYYSGDPEGERVRIPFNGGTYAWKNLLHWWENEHFNPDGKKTSWSPKMKKIWFTEFGFPSLHGASNTPNIFYNPASQSGGLPKSSNGTINFDLQALCIEASIEYWREKNEEHEGIVDKMFLWCFDARPYPYYPLNLNIWSDGELHAPGHWVNGKLGAPLISDVLKDLLNRTDFWFFQKKQLELQEFFYSDINIRIDGFAVGNSSQTILDLILSLQDFYPFDMIETDDGNFVLKFLSKSSKNSSLSLSFDEDLLICDSEKFLPLSDGVEFDSKNISKIKTNIDYENQSSIISVTYFSKEQGFETRLLNFSLDEVDLK
jgi:hypothetical protein